MVTCTADIGEAKDIEEVTDRALRNGATAAYAVDARRLFVEEFCFPTLAASAMYEGAYPLATALARPLIAKILVDVARDEGAEAIAHGCTGKGNDQVRFDVATAALAPELEVVAPVRDWDMGRPQEIDYAREHGIEIPVTQESPYSVDANLWGRSVEAGPLEDPWREPAEEVFAWTAEPSGAPAEGAVVTLVFERGIPTALDGERLAGEELVTRLNALAGAHGVGRIDHVENRLVGIKSREVYEAPAATVLHAAHTALETLTLGRDVFQLKRQLAGEWARLVYDGLWFGQLRSALAAFVRITQEPVSGEVRLRLRRGTVTVDRSARPRIPLPRGARHLRPPPGRVRPLGGAGIHRDLRAVAAHPGAHPAGVAGHRSPAPGAPGQAALMPRPSMPSPRRAPTKVWEGRLGSGTDRRVEEYTSSLDFDRRLYAEDIEGSLAHALMLREVGLLTAQDHRAIAAGLRTVRRELERGEFVADPADEDVHTAVERRLHELAGPVAGRLHTARSRNDQVATDLRLWCRRRVAELMLGCAGLQEALIRRARDHRAPRFPATPTPSVPRWSRWLTTSSPMSRRCSATSSGWRARAGAPTLCPSEAAPWPAPPCPSTEGWCSASWASPPSAPTASTPSPTGTSRSSWSSPAPCSWSTSPASLRSWCSGPPPSSGSPSCPTPTPPAPR